MLAHSSPKEEKKLGFPFSENGPSAVQGHVATSPFSDLGEWEERGVTTPIAHALSSSLALLRKLAPWLFTEDSLLFFSLSLPTYVRFLNVGLSIGG
jgi:hypothetical protein